LDRFLLARLSVDSLLDKRTKAKVESALRKLSKGSKSSDQAYGEAYKDAMERIESQLPEDRKLAKTVISWITYAKRQLTTKELGEALAVEPGDSELNEDNIPDAEDILSVCCGLVTVDKESQVVRLIHYTAQEYFEKILDEWNPTAQLQIASTCLSYLSFKPFKAFQWVDIRWYPDQKVVEPHALLDYAAQNWGPHASAIQQEVSEQACALLQDINLVACINKVLNSRQVINFKMIHLDGMADDATRLHLVARLGLDHILEKALLLPNSGPADAKNRYMQTPLTWAAIWGNLAAVEVLFKRDDVNVNMSDILGRTPLTWAVLEGHKEVVKLFLERDDVDVDSKDALGRRPLFYAAGLDTETITRLFLERGADVSDSKDDDDDYTLLSYAAIRGCPATIQLLLERGVDPNLKGGNLTTPLHYAVTRGNNKGCAAIVELLLQHGAKTEARDNNGKTPLHWAVGKYADRPLVAARKLLEYGAKTDSDDNSGRTPLDYAIEHQHHGIILLLETARGIGQETVEPGHTLSGI
jgi:ankyrin repeat protein